MVGYTLLGTFGAYVLTSVVFLKYPQILHQKRKRNFFCSHISHRGGAAERLENTIPAFQHAFTCGTDMFELDVHLTKDKKVVVCHDVDLQRVTGVQGLIKDYFYEELPHLKNVLEVTFAKETQYTSKDPERKIPLLEDVFQMFPHLPINIDIKDNDDELIEATVELVAKYKREDLVVWGNGNAAVIDKLRAKNANVATFFSSKRVAMLILSFYLGFLPFINIQESFLEVPLVDSIFQMRIQLTSSQKLLVRFGGFLLNSSTLIGHLKARGIPTYFWVLNDEASFKKAFELGAEGVMTDYPSKLAKWLDDNPNYKHTKHLSRHL